MSDFDAIVIGGGIGGLVSAGSLAASGMKVLLLEKNRTPGGYLQSFRRKGFTFDSSIDCFSGLDEHGPIRAVLEVLGVTDLITPIRLDPIRLSLLPDLRVTVHADIDRYKNELTSLFPDEAEGVTKLFSVMRLIYGDILRWSDNLVKGTEDEAMPLNIMRYSEITFAGLLDGHINDPLLKSVLSDRCPFYGLPPSKVGAVAMTALVMSYFSSGAYRVKGGSERLAEALTLGIERAGGVVRFDETVEEIRCEGAKAVSIRTASGEEITAKHIVSNIDYNRTVGMLKGGGFSVEPTILKPSSSFFILYVGAKVDLEHLDGASSVGYFPTAEMEDNFTPEAAFSPEASIGITIPSLTDPSMAPEGMHSIAAHEMVDFSYTSSWKERKAELTDKVLEKVERAIPGITKGAVHIEAATPATLLRYTGNTNGAAYGWQQTPSLRPVRLPVKNLHLAGHWQGIGGGVVAAAYSGLKAARDIEKNL